MQMSHPSFLYVLLWKVDAMLTLNMQMHINVEVWAFGEANPELVVFHCRFFFPGMFLLL